MRKGVSRPTAGRDAKGLSTRASRLSLTGFPWDVPGGGKGERYEVHEAGSMRDRKPILCLDFDGVIHSYTSGWQGADVVSDPPVDGAIPFMYIAQRHFIVAVFSSRSRQTGGIEAMRRWLKHHAKHHEDAHLMPADWIDDVEWPAEKPPAFVTIDDRAITFTGTWPDVDELRTFKPWNKKEEAA